MQRKRPLDLVINNNNTATEQAVIDFVVWFFGDDRKTITLETLVVQDLGIDGTDALSFLTAFSKRFAVDISEFQKAEYFHDERYRHRFSVWRLFFQGHGYPVHDLKDLRISDLVRAAEQKKLPPA